MKDRAQINRLLGSKGLSTLDDPRGLVQQLGFLVQDHDHLRQMLTKCAPEHRRDMYESLKPHLGFEARPLDVYIAEAGSIAERKQLPTVGPNGELLPFHTPVIGIGPDLVGVQAAVAEVFAKGNLELICRKCTRAETFAGANRSDAIHQARKAGWTYDEQKGDGREICPDCPGSSAPTSRADFQLVAEFKLQPLEVISRYMQFRSDWTPADFDAHSLEAARRWKADQAS